MYLHRLQIIKGLKKSIGLWRWYINITITILDIILRPVFYLKQCFGDWFLYPSGVRRRGLYLSTGPNWVGSTWRRGQNPVSETLRMKQKTGRWIMSRIVTVILFICSTFNDAYSDGTERWMIVNNGWKECGRPRSLPNFCLYLNPRLNGLSKPHSGQPAESPMEGLRNKSKELAYSVTGSWYFVMVQMILPENPRGLSPRANYTDRGTVACRWS
jgi:hypothetical protein